MKRKELNAMVEQALSAYSQGKAPTVGKYKAVVGKAGKPAEAYVASIKAVKRANKAQVAQAHDEYEQAGFTWARDDDAVGNTRKKLAFEFAGACSEELALVKAGVKRFYAEKKAQLRASGPCADAKGNTHVGAAKAIHTLDQRQGELVAIVDAFDALYNMALTGDGWDIDAASATFEGLAALEWNELVAACRTIRSVNAGKGLTVDEAKRIAAKRATVKKADDKAKPQSTSDLIEQAKSIALALAQRGNVKGIDVAMLLRALGAQHQAGETEIKRALPVKAQAEDLRASIKAKLDGKAPTGMMAAALAKAA